MTKTLTFNTFVCFLNDYKTDYHYGLIPGSATIVLVGLVVGQTTAHTTHNNTP